jgi:hypothetical protein
MQNIFENDNSKIGLFVFGFVIIILMLSFLNNSYRDPDKDMSDTGNYLLSTLLMMLFMFYFYFEHSVFGYIIICLFLIFLFI